MVFQGHFENGVVIPHGTGPFPDGTQVTITVSEAGSASKEAMSDRERQLYLAALAHIDSLENENPGDAAKGAEHDRYLYGERS